MFPRCTPRLALSQLKSTATKRKRVHISVPALLDPYLPPYCGLLDFNGFDLDPDLDLVPDSNSSCLQHLIPGQPELPAIDLAGCAEPHSLATPWILRLTLELDVQRDRLGHVTNGQLTLELEFLPISFDAGASEFDLGILLGVQKIARPKVLVPLVGAGIDARRFENCFDRRISGIFFIDVDRAFNVCDPPLDGGDHQMLRGEFDQGMRRVELPFGLGSRCGGHLNWCGHRFLSNLVRFEAVTPLIGVHSSRLTVSKVVYFSKQIVSSTRIRKLLIMADSSLPISQVCSRFHRAIELIGSRWTGAILQTLLQGRTRYAAIKSAIPDITDRMLSERLRSLEGEALLVRIVIPETPVRVEYELTLKGHELQNALREIGSWAERWIPLASDVNDENADESNADKRHPARHARKTRSA